MKLISWNTNGLRACLGKGFMEYFNAADADIFCLQETKMQPGQAQVDTPGYRQIWHSAVRKGYSGTALFSKREPISVQFGLGEGYVDDEGRAITAEYDGFYCVTVYTPNAQQELKRLEYRLAWEEQFRRYATELAKTKPVIICGDLNVAHQEIDLKNPGSNRGNPGFSDEERACMTQLLNSGFVDTFRHLHPDTRDAYSWWSYRMNARARNTGWRIDYFLVSQALQGTVSRAFIESQVPGSDHCPVGLELDM